jgi:PBP1b-binding outer membrane lipoprotein LpoB
MINFTIIIFKSRIWKIDLLENKMIKKLILICFSAFILSGCAAVAVGGYAYYKVANKETCADLMSDKDFAEKMKIDAYKKTFKEMCDD